MDDFTGADISAAMSGGSDASASDAGASAATATTTTETTAQPGAATTQPAATPITPTKPPGPIPFDAHKTALENARTKAVEEYERQYGWAKGLSKADYDAAVALARRTQTDPIGYVRDLIAELQQHPTHGPALRSEAARALAAGRSTPEPEPDVTITDEHGNPIERTYSAAQLAKREAWLKEQWMGEVRKEIAPLVQTHKTIEKRAQDEYNKAEAETWSKGFGTELKDLPHFEANKQAIGHEVVRILHAYEQQNPGATEAMLDFKSFLEAATLRAYHRVVTANLDALSRQAAVHDLTTKAGNSGVTPGRMPVGAPKSNTSGKFSGADIAEEFNRRKLG